MIAIPCSKSPAVVKAFLFRGCLAGLIMGILVVICMPRFCFPADINAIVAETLTGRLSAKNGFSWRYSYDIAFRESKVFVHVAIHLIPAGGVTKLELDRAKTTWEQGIEETWSNEFSIGTMSGQKYPIIVDVTFNGSWFHHDVIVRPGGGRSEVIHWNILDSPAIVAHEFGHMIGVYDEYKRGAIDPQLKTIDATSIMTSNPTAGVTYARHYKQFLAWFSEKTGWHGAALFSVDSEALTLP